MNSKTIRKTSGSRRKIIDLLKRNGAMDAASLAEPLDMSAMAVRQHLYTLVEQGLVVATSSPDGIGRPSKRWQLTQAAEEFFPQGYAELTASLLGTIREAFGESGIEKIVSLRTSEQEKAYRQQLNGAEGLAARLEKLAEIRSSEGYMAEVERLGEDYLFIENHCPICSAAKACTGLCSSELALFCSVLGDQVRVERVEHILQGARRCAYRVSVAG